jgi:hypothetical protein
MLLPMPKKLVKPPAKRTRIVVGINSLVSTTQPAYSNHIQLFFRFGRNYPNTDFILDNPTRMSIDRMRNQAAEVALQAEADYLMFIDDDVLVPFDCLTKLLALDADIASADVIIRSYPFDHMLFYWSGKHKEGLTAFKKLPEPRGPLDIGACGFSLCLIKVGLLKRILPPYFVTGPHSNTEDIYFCCKAKKIYPEVTVRADTSIICSHILWHETIDSFNKKAYTRYWEAINGKPEKEIDNRGPRYLAMTKEALSAKKAS